MAHLERDLRNMDEKIEVLEDIIDEYKGVISDTTIEKLQAVVDRWRDCTRETYLECIRLKLKGVLDDL